MSRDITQSTVFRLIEAGQLARLALQNPLGEMGLFPGDDAVLFLLKRNKPVSDQTLCRKTGLNSAQLRPRIERLVAHSLIRKSVVGTKRSPMLRLTKNGRRVRNNLLARWGELEAALMDELRPKQRRRLEKTLDRFVELLVL